MKKIKLYNKISPKGLDLFDDTYQVSEDLEDADGILVRSAKLHDIYLDGNLKAIARAGAGVNNVPVDKCSEKGIVVFNTPGANANAVKELVLAGLMMAARPTYNAMQWLQTVKKEENIGELAEKEKSKFKGIELAGKTLGVIGLGAIGIKVANMAYHLDMEVIGYDPFLSVNSALQLSRHVKLTKNLDDIYRNCDFITLHLPFNEKTKNMIDIVALAKMKDGVSILNYARGGLVDDNDMLKALRDGKVKYYISDFASSKLMNEKNYLCTPHLGASTPEAEENCAVMAVQQMRDYLENGNITNSVNLPNVHMDRTGDIRITCFHKNVPNMLAQISQAISEAGLNIENMINKSKNDYAYTMVDVNKADIASVVEKLNAIDAILKINVYE